VDRLIRELVALRDSGCPAPFVILNACIDRLDVDKAQETLAGLLAYRPDDLKLLVVAEDAAAVQGHGSRRVVSRLLQTARSLRPEGCELLERKILGLFRSNSSGLTDPDGRHLVRRCYLPLTERTLDSAFCYPCSIYLRYHGRPLCPAAAPFGTQQAATARFIRTHDCREDPICSVNCTSCCREYNVCLNRGLLEQEQQRLLESTPAITAPEASDAAVAQALDTMRAIAAQDTAPLGPFMVIRPLGMPHRDEILAYLAGQRLGAMHAAPIRDWPQSSLFLYHKSRGDGDEFAMRKRLAVNAAFSLMEPGQALAVGFEPVVPVAKVHRLRADIRRWYPDRLRLLQYNGVARVLRASVVHAPDPQDLWWENRVVRFFAPGW